MRLFECILFVIAASQAWENYGHIEGVLHRNELFEVSDSFARYSIFNNPFLESLCMNNLKIDIAGSQPCFVASADKSKFSGVQLSQLLAVTNKDPELWVSKGITKMVLVTKQSPNCRIMRPMPRPISEPILGPQTVTLDKPSLFPINPNWKLNQTELFFEASKEPQENIDIGLTPLYMKSLHHAQNWNVGRDIFIPFSRQCRIFLINYCLVCYTRSYYAQYFSGNNLIHQEWHNENSSEPVLVPVDSEYHHFTSLTACVMFDKH